MIETHKSSETVNSIKFNLLPTISSIVNFKGELASLRWSKNLKVQSGL